MLKKEQMLSLPLKELQAMAKDFGIKSPYKYNKSELVDRIIPAGLLHEQAKNGSKEADPENKKRAPQFVRSRKPAAKEKKPAEEPKTKRTLPDTDSSVTPDPIDSDTDIVEPKNELRPENEADSLENAEDTREAGDAVPETRLKQLQELDSGEKGGGILEIIVPSSPTQTPFGFLRVNGFMPSDGDLYISNAQIKRFQLHNGDEVYGSIKIQKPEDKYRGILQIETINGRSTDQHEKLTPFEKMTPEFPHSRLRLETVGGPVSMRIIDLLCPIGKGQRGMIVAQPKVGKTTLLRQIAQALLTNHPELKIIILLIDERPEEVTEMQDKIRDNKAFEGKSVDIVYSTFDEQPEHHKKTAEFVIEGAKRQVEAHQDVVILLDSITRLTRAYNLTVTPSGRTLSGGLDPAALYMPKRFFGAARCMREGGSLTILATALQETGSRLDDVVYEEFKGTGNMELVLNRKLSEQRIFPAIDILKSSTRQDERLLTETEMEVAKLIRKVTTTGAKPEVATEQVLNLFAATKSNEEFIAKISRINFGMVQLHTPADY